MEQRDAERRVLDAVGRALGRFAMLRPRDRVAVSVSGGKDTLFDAGLTKEGADVSPAFAAAPHRSQAAGSPG